MVKWPCRETDHSSTSSVEVDFHTTVLYKLARDIERRLNVIVIVIFSLKHFQGVI